jgi:hypothetical protein
MINNLQKEGFKIHRENRNLYFTKEIAKAGDEDKREVVLMFGADQKAGKTLMNIFERLTYLGKEKQGDYTVDESIDDIPRAMSMTVDTEQSVWSALQSFGYEVGPKAEPATGEVIDPNGPIFTQSEEQKAAQERIDKAVAEVNPVENDSPNAPVVE